MKERRKIVIGVAAMLVMAIMLIVAMVLPDAGEPEPTRPSENNGLEYENMEPIELGQGLRIRHVGAYSGVYMEDGTNEDVSGVMMVILENAGDKDLQLARFSLKYNDSSAEFEVTNLPAGASTVALERSRRNAAGVPDTADLSTVAFFRQNMNLMENALKLTGQKGSISVENISGSDISGDIWIYYKYSATDLFYGGITFRAKLSGGLKAGQSAQVSAGHYDPDGSKLVCVTVGA